jgi:hypothetical protein
MDSGESTLWMTLPAICDLASRKQWVCWKRVKRNGKETKIPYQPNGKRASSTGAQTWGEMPTCFTEVVAGKFDGLGYVLAPDDARVCVDLDHCIRSDGTLEPWAAKIVEALDSYTEISPSGDGLHIWVIAHVSFTGRRSKQVEIYVSGRYMTVTAKPWPGTPETINERTDVIEKLVADFPSPPVKPPAMASDATISIDPEAEPPSLRFNALMENEARFQASWKHKRKDLGDQSLSSYDMSLATLAAYAEWTDQEIANLIIAHRREHGNPEKALRLDYLQRTIQRARQATDVSLKDYEAAEVHRVGETREVETQEGLSELSMLLALDIRRVVQRGRDPASYALETESFGEIHIGGPDILLSANKAREKLVSTSEIYIPKMKQRDWERIVALIVQLHEFEEVAEGQRNQQIGVWTRAYLMDHPPSEPETTKALHAMIKTDSWPIKWEQKIQVRSQDLKRFLFAAMGEKPTIAVICTLLRESGWIPAQLAARDGESTVKARVWAKEIRNDE